MTVRVRQRQGAEYESQGKARSKAERVAPGPTALFEQGLKRPK